MRGGRGSNGAPTDLLVCFPSRAHLALMPPKHTCSPSRPAAAEPVKRRHSTSRAGPPAPSPLFTARNPRRRSAASAADIAVDDDEPTSPKVTCAGQIKARPAKPKGRPGGKAKKPTWLEALGLKKEAVPFLNALHGAFRLNVAGCFGSFPSAVDYSSGEDDCDDERTEKEAEHSAALAKWFMVLEEGKKDVKRQEQQGEEKEEEEVVAPPKDALMLMRCRSAPARGWLRREEECGEEEEEVKSAKKVREEEEEKEKLVLMSYAPDFFKVSMDIAKETWVGGGGGGDDAFFRCRSSRR